MKKYPKVRRLGDERNERILDHGDLLVQEKLDGANFRFCWSDEQLRFMFGSRNVVYKHEKDTAKAFTHAVEAVKEDLDRIEYWERHALYDGLTVFAEAMHPHTLDYDWENTPSVLVYDVWDDSNGWWARPQDFADAVGLEAAPVLYDGPAEEIPTDLVWDGDIAIPDSEYRDGKAEGVVFKNLDTDQKAKYRSQEFKERHKTQKASNSDGEREVDASTRLAYQFTTEARVKKEIAKMRDDGHDVNMGMMDTLWRRVYDDVIEEGYNEILTGNHVLDTGEFRSNVASRTASILDTILSRPENSVLNDGVIQ